MSWTLVMEPPHGDLAGDFTMSLPVEPLTWLEPIKPYRWMLEGGIAILFFLALYSLLKPKVNI